MGYYSMGKLGSKVVLIVGLPGSGKDVATEALEEELGYKAFRMSDELLEELERRRLPITRENMRKVGMELRKERGMAAIAKLVISKMKKSDSDYFVVNGVRNPEEIEEFKREFGDEVLTIAIIAPKKLRFLRQLKRKRSGFDESEYSRFLEEDEKEIRTFHMGDAMASADYFVLNDGGIEELKWKIVSIVLGSC